MSEEALEISVQGWAESSRSLQAICGVRGIAYVHVLQPTLHDADSKPLTRDELATSTGDPTQVEATLLGYPRLRDVGQELLAQGVRFVDASRVFDQVEQTLYMDMCHFTQAGHELLAELIARALLAEVPSLTPPAWAGRSWWR